jgi:sulfonate transport system substrate-binding protein
MKRKKFSIIITLMTFIVALGILSGCGNKANTKTEPDQVLSTSNENKYEGVTVSIDAGQFIPLIAKEKGFFEEEFNKFGADVEYQTLQSGSEMLEGIASNHLDFALTGYIGTITGQASNTPFISIGEGSDGGGDGLIVQKDSPVQSIKDLVGKKIAVTKGSSSWGLLLRALDKEGLKPSDIELINLPPGDGQAAFQSGKVDAWVVWEPFRTTQINDQQAKLIVDAKSLGTIPGFTIVRTKFAEQYPELVGAYLKAYKKAVDWQENNFDEAVTLLAPLKNLDEETIRISLTNSVPAIQPISEETKKNQQSVADILFNLGETKEQLDISEVIDNSYIEKALSN